MARVILTPGETFTVFNSTASVEGGSGSEKLLIGGTSSAVTVSQTVERVDLSGNLADYTFKAVGNSVEVRSGGTVVATIGVQDDSNGSLVAFADGSGYLNYATTGTAIQLGGATISTSTAGAITTAQVGNFDTTTKSGSSSLGGTTSTNQTFTLTTGLNNLAGGTGNDFFDASTASTLNSFDTLDGSTGTDTLFASIAAGTTVSPTLSNIETVQISSSGTGTAVLDLAGSTGYTAIENTGSTATVSTTVQNIASTATALKLSNTSAAASFAWQDSTVSGTADSVTLTLSNVSGSAVTIPSYVETTNLVSTTASNSVALNLVASATVTASGSSALTISSLSGTTTKFDWSAATGAVTFTPNAVTVSLIGGSGNDTITAGSTTPRSINGGAGDDSITANLAVGDTIVGGSGSDTLTTSSAGLVTFGNGATGSVTGVETLTLSDALGSSAALAKFNADLATVAIPSTSGALTLTANSGATTVNFGNKTAGTLGGTLTLVAAGTGTSDSVTLGNTTLSSSKNANVTNGNSVTTTGFETVTLSTGTVTSTLVQTISTLTADGTVTGTGAKVSVTGSNGLKIGTALASSTTGILSFDASAMTAQATGNTLEITTSTNTASTGSFSITGSAGNDSITVGNFAATISGGAGNDAITSGSGNDSLLGSAGADTLTSGSGNDTLDGGEGSDTYGFTGSNLGLGDTIADSGLTGTDTITAPSVTGTLGAAAISGIETINLGLTGATTLDTSSIVGVSTIGVSGASTLTLTNLAANPTIALGYTGTGTTNFASTLTFGLKDASGASDSATLSLGNVSSTDVNATVVAAAGIESLTIAAGAIEAATLNLNGTVIPALTITGGLAGKTLDLRGSGSAALNTAVTSVNASGFSGVLAAIASSTTGTAFTVKGSGGADTLVGGAGNDTFTLTASGTSAYTITGGAGNDSLVATLGSTGTSFNAGGVSGVENISLTLPTATAFTSSTGANNAGLNSTTKLTISGGSAVSTSSLKLGSYSAPTAAGTNGDTNTSNVTIGSTATSTIDTSGFAGAVDLNISSQAAALYTGGVLKGGSGSSDVLRYTVSSTAGYTGITAGSISGFESIVVTTTNSFSTTLLADSASQDLTNVSGVNTITVGGNNSYTLNNLAAGVALKLGDDSASTGVGFADGKTLTATWTTTSSASDAVTVNLGRAYVAGSVTAVTSTTSLSGVTLSLPGIENITLTQSALTNGTAFGLKIQDTNTNNVSITVNGGLASRALTLVSGALQSNVTTISATDFAGNLVMNTNARSGSGAMTITGGNGSDTIVMKNASDSLVGGSGNDTLILSVAGNDKFTFDLSAADQVVTWNGDSNAAIQSGFENFDAGGIIGSTLGVKVLGAAAAGSSITGTSYSDTINGGTGNDTITGGDGVDYIDVSTGSSSSDRIVYTATGQSLNSISSSALQAGIQTGDFLGVTGVLGTDLITGMARGDTIQISYLTSSNSPTAFNRGFSTTGLTAGSSNAADAIFQMSKGSYIGTGLWTFDATNGNDVLFQWDTNGSAAGGYVESVVLIGSASAFTGITANSAGVILFT